MAINQWYKGVKEYLWPSEQNPSGTAEQEENEQMGRLSRIKRITQILEGTCYLVNEQQQICMFYGSVIDEYPQARCSKIHPSFLYEPDVYVPLVNFTVPIKIQTPQLYCELEITIIFEEGLSAHPPTFYIRNPDFTKYKPRDKFVRFGKEIKETHKYEAVYGGVRVLMPLESGQRWEWTPQAYYKQENVLSMIKWIHKFLLLDYFPFAKRKTPLSTDIVRKSYQLRDFLDKNVILSKRENDLQEIPLLQAIQSANTLSLSIQAQTDILKEDIAALKDVIAQSESLEISDFLPEPKDKKSAIILDAMSSLEACKDVENQIEQQFMKGKIDFSQAKVGFLEISQRKFENYYTLFYWKSPELLW